jgi:hypothetical protein
MQGYDGISCRNQANSAAPGKFGAEAGTSHRTAQPSAPVADYAIVGFNTSFAARA